MRLGETRNTYRILVHASWRVVIFKTVKFGTSILVKKKSFKNGHRKGRKRCIIWENYSKAEGERRTSICGPVTNGPRYRRAGRFIHNNQFKVELVRNLVAHGDAREVKWRGNWRMKCVASTLTPPPNVVYPALLKLMGTTRLPVVDWTDAPTDLNGLVRFGERGNLVSARVPSRSARAVPHIQRLNEMSDCKLTSGRVCTNGPFNTFSSQNLITTLTKFGIRIFILEMWVLWTT